MEILIRIDDFGFSEAVNHGVMKAFEFGLVKNIGLMSNMPAAKHAFELIKERKDVSLGLHVNLILGCPCAKTIEVASLLDDEGKFISSKIRREELKQGIDGFLYEDTLIEVQAQIEEFIQICNRLPDYIDAHAVCTETSERAISDAAKMYGIKVLGHVKNDIWEGVQNDFTNEEFYRKKMKNVEFFKSFINYSKKISLIVFHPGYLDNDVLLKSSLTINRCKDLSLLTDMEVKEYLKKEKIELHSFKEVGEIYGR